MNKELETKKGPEFWLAVAKELLSQSQERSQAISTEMAWFFDAIKNNVELTLSDLSKFLEQNPHLIFQELSKQKVEN